jgi:hypothetical protein
VGIYRSMMGLVLRRPFILPALLGLAWSSRRRGWWRTAPFLPLPPRSYLAWRSETAWGEADGTGSDEAVVRYLRWTREMRRRQRRRV